MRKSVFVLVLVLFFIFPVYASHESYVHIVYANDNDLTYVSFDGNIWSTKEDFTWDVIVKEESKPVSLDLDSSGVPHISYYGGGLYYATRRGNQWFIETVDSGYIMDSGTSNDIFVGSDDEPRIVYNKHYDLKYAWRDGCWNCWYNEDVADTDDDWNSITSDSSGNPHVSFIAGQSLVYANKTLLWNTQLLENGYSTLFYTSIALDSNNMPHISYHETSDLKYARWNGTHWEKEYVDRVGNVGKFNSIALDSKGRPHIAYYDLTNGDLKYATKTGTSWNIQTFSTLGGDFGKYASIAIDGNDRPHIVYVDDGLLKYSSFDGNIWQHRSFYNTGTARYTTIEVYRIMHPPIHVKTDFYDSSSVDRLNVEFVDNSTDETKWEIEISTDGMSWSKIATVNSTTSSATGTIYSYTDSGRNSNTKYYYRVRSVRDNYGYSKWITSTAVNPSTGNSYKYTRSNKASDLSVSNITDSSLVLSWNANNPSGTQSYKERCDNPSFTINCVGSGWTIGTSYSFGNLSPNKLYYFRVKTKNGDGVETPWSSTVSVYTLPNKPSLTYITKNNDTVSVRINKFSNPDNTLYSFKAQYQSQTYYVKSDGYITINQNEQSWKTYNQWGGLSGTSIRGFAPNSNYLITAKAQNGNYTNTNDSNAISGYTLANPVSGFSIDTGELSHSINTNPNSIISRILDEIF